jgi:hypothetical protein
MKILKHIFQKSRSAEDGIFFNDIQNIIGFKPKSIIYYQKAFTHRSTNQMDLKGNPMNYGTDKGTYINIGSLISDGSTTLDNTTQYKVTFAPLMTLSDILGLTSISTTDAVNKNGTQLKIKLN